MPQAIFMLIAFILGIIIAAYVLAAIVWAAQWAWAGMLWFWETVLQPLFIYFLPAGLVTILALGIMVGFGIGAYNYFQSLKDNVVPEDFLGELIKFKIIAVLFLVFTIGCMGVIHYSIPFVQTNSNRFVTEVQQHYATIRFPAFEIHFPFWKQHRASRQPAED